MLQRLKVLLGVENFGLCLIALCITAWIAAIVATGAGLNLFPVNWNFQNSGAFGDSFGPLSALMASIAAVSAIAAYKNQATEISRLKERQRLDDIQGEINQKLSEERQVRLDRDFRNSRIEETFFKLLESLREIVSQVDIKTSSGSNKDGPDAFGIMLKFAENSKLSSGGDFKAVWNRVNGRYKNDLNHYHRFMYHIVNFVDDSPLDNKYFYVRLLRATLSEAQIVLLGLNCEYGEGRPSFLFLVEKYSLLHNMSCESRSLWFENTSIKLGAFETAPKE